MAPARAVIREILEGKHTGRDVELRGWVYRIRSSGAIVFAVMRDATGVVQTTVKKGVATEEGFLQAKGAGMEACVILTGTVVPDPRAPGGYEVKCADFRVVGPSQEIPIYETDEVEQKLNKRHLWLRSRHYTNVMRVKAALLDGFRHYFHENAFTEVTPSVITTNACEGGSTLFEFDYFGEKAFLSQSSQMYLEALSFSLERVWCLAPSFRAEKSRTSKHLTEFWHLEAEEAWVDNAGNMDIEEALVETAARHVAEHAERELVELGQEPSKLKEIRRPFERVHYDDAVDVVKRNGVEMEWGEDFGVPHERALMKDRDKPLFVYNFPAEIKAFYMALDEDGVSAKCADLMAPHGYGEIIGGSERSLDIALMQERLKKQNTPLEPYEWYFDLRRYGSVPHSGFGLGTERLLTYFAGLEHIRDAVPFPRTINRAYP